MYIKLHNMIRFYNEVDFKMCVDCFSKIDKEFVILCFETDSLFGKSNLIDSYCGTQFVFSETSNFNDLKERFCNLKLKISDNVDDVFPFYKKSYLIAHINDILTQINLVQGDTPDFYSVIDNLYDISASHASIDNIINLHKKISDLLCVKGLEHGTLKQRVLKWKQDNSISTKKFVYQISNELNNYKKMSFSLFSNEDNYNLNSIYDDDIVELNTVDTNQGWSAYNNYNSNYKGNIEFNASAKFNQYSVKTFLTHEAYPGHHFSSLFKEYLYKNNCIENYAVLNLLKTPSSLIEEGIGDCGLKILNLLPNTIDEKIEKALDDLSAEVDYLVAELVYENNATTDELYDILLNYKFMKDKEDASRSIQFIKNWTLYVPVYKLGREIVSTYIDTHSFSELKYLYYPCTAHIIRNDKNE